MSLLALSYSIVTNLFEASRDFQEKYKRIEVNSAREVLDAIMERQPDLIIRFSNRDVFYYEQVGMEKKLKGGVIGEYKDGEVNAQTLAELPYFYGAVLVVMDTNSNAILMKTRLGEERFFHTAFGAFSTDGGFKSIPEKVQNQLLSSDQGMGEIIVE